MTIVVCIKQVPDTAELSLDPETNTLIREGVEAVLNPLDQFPLETALALRDQVGGSITAITMGPAQAEDVLRKAVAMGVDHAVLVSDRAFAGSDTWATSLTLARAIQTLGDVDLILCGKQAIDGDTAQVGPGIAAHLGIPQVTYVTAVEGVEKDSLRVKRLLDHGTACLRVPLPACLTILKEANEPRFPSLQGRLRALALTPRQLGLADLALPAEETGLDGSPTRVIRIAAPQSARAHTRLSGDPDEVAGQLAAALRERV